MQVEVSGAPAWLAVSIVALSPTLAVVALIVAIRSARAVRRSADAAEKSASASEILAKQVEEDSRFIEAGWWIVKRDGSGIKYRAINRTRKPAFSVNVSGEKVVRRTPNSFLEVGNYIDFKTSKKGAKKVIITWWLDPDKGCPPFQRSFDLPP